jgi:GntR family transcriptional regulator
VPRRAIPRHEAVERHIHTRIAALRPGDPLESDAEPCQLFRVSCMTVRQATQRLVAEGAIYRVPGVGAFDGEARVPRHIGHLRSFTQEMTHRNKNVSSRMLASETRPGSRDEAVALRLKRNDLVVHLRRLGLADGEPMVIEDVVLPEQFRWLLERDLVTGSLHENLTRAGHEPARAAGTQVALLAGSEDAALLDLSYGDALFVERRVVSAADGTPIERTESRYAANRFVFHIELVH